MNKTYTGLIKKLNPNQIFVFGSNTEGRHGGGAAKQAMSFGAIYGCPKGQQGNTYAIITKDLAIGLRSIPKWQICDQISDLYVVALCNPDREFLITYSGTGVNLNGYSPKEMAELFYWATFRLHPSLIPANIVFEEGFDKLVHEASKDYTDEKQASYWLRKTKGKK
jgi:hypothetical protein